MNYDELLSLMQARRSIRHFKEHAVSREDLRRLLDAARSAPSNHNRQPWKFIVMEDRDRIRTLAEQVGLGMEMKLKSLSEVVAGHAVGLLAYGTLFSSAPVLMVAMHKLPIAAAAPLWAGTQHPALVSGEALSVAMAIQNLLLAAHALGLGACVMTAPLLADNLSALLQVPPGFDITALIAVGYPDESPPAPRRKPLAHIAEFDNEPL